MLNIKNLENSWFFKSLILEKWEILFDEWEINENIYIVKLWELTVEKYISKERKETKVLDYIKSNEIIWEAALNNNKPKQVKIIAIKKTYLLSINATNWIEKFSQKYPEESIILFKYMINLWNVRLLESNNLITISYRISKEIIKLKQINNKTLFNFIDNLKEIINVNHILYFEKNPVIEKYLTLKYDTREKGKMLDQIVENTENKLNLLNLRINNFYEYVQKLAIWDNILWYIIFIKNWSRFNENEKRILISTSISISWLIKQKLMLEDEKNKNYMEIY